MILIYKLDLTKNIKTKTSSLETTYVIFDFVSNAHLSTFVYTIANKMRTKNWHIGGVELAQYS